MIYYSKQIWIYVIDGRASHALPILWRIQYRPRELLRKLWSRSSIISSAKSKSDASTTPGRSTSIARTPNYFATISTTTRAADASNTKAPSSNHAVSTYADY